MSDTITVYVSADDVAPHTILSESEFSAAYAQMLDDAYGTVTIAGIEFDTSSALEAVDPIAFRTGMLEYADSAYHELEMPWAVYISGDIDAQIEWIDAQF